MLPDARHNAPVGFLLMLLGKVSKWIIQGSVAWLTFVPGSRPRRMLSRLLFGLQERIKSDPRLAALACRFLSLFPQVRERLGRMGNPLIVPGQIEIKQAGDDSTLSPRARQIFCDLVAATKTKRTDRKGC